MLPPSVLRRPSTYRSTSVPRSKGVQGATKDDARQGKGDTVEEEGYGRRRGTREERRIRGANQRRNRPFHLYAARIQLTLHLLPSFFISSRCPACLCALPYTGCSSARARITMTLVKNVHCTTWTHLCLIRSVPVTSLTKLRVLNLTRRMLRMFDEGMQELSRNWSTMWNVSSILDFQGYVFLWRL